MTDPEPICAFFGSVSEPEAQDLMKILDPSVLLGTGCKVEKRPNCCVLCRLNEDCSRIPLHINCKCTPAPYLTFGESA